MNAPSLSTHVLAASRVPNTHAAALPVVGIHHSCCREVLRLNKEHARLQDELERLRAEHEDLRKSAELWIHLYEMQLNLANGRVATCEP